MFGSLSSILCFKTSATSFTVLSTFSGLYTTSKKLWKACISLMCIPLVFLDLPCKEGKALVSLVRNVVSSTR